MSRLIIYVTGKPNLHGHKRREFIWSPPHGVYLYTGKEIPAEAFNAAYEKAMKTNADMNPRVKVVDVRAAVPAPSVDTNTKPDAPNLKGVTLEEAEAVLRCLAPHRLKKKTGPKTVVPALEVS